MEKIPVAVLGATGMVGIEVVKLLTNHPWFDVTYLCASDIKRKKSYAEFIPHNHLALMTDKITNMTLSGYDDIQDVGIVFSCVPACVAQVIEPHLVKKGFYISSNSSNDRLSDFTQLIIPEINDKPINKKIIKCPNCCVAALAPVLHSIETVCSVKTLHVMTLQAISGAGFRGKNIDRRLHTTIEGEKKKIYSETKKLVNFQMDLDLSIQVNRIPIDNCHTICVYMKTTKPISKLMILDAFDSLNQQSKRLCLPSVSNPLIDYRDELNFDYRIMNKKHSMSICVSQLDILDSGAHFYISINNLIRGAAGATVLNAELISQQMFSSVFT